MLCDVPPNRAAAAGSYKPLRGRTWRNWAGIETAHPLEIIAPTDNSQIAEAVADATANGRTIRMVGSGHSFTSAAVINDTMLLPNKFKQVHNIDRERNQITMDAGIDLTTLCEVLADNGLALTNMGDIRVQTISGAIQTGTHGTGRASGTFAAMVTELELVKANGDIVTVNTEQDHDLFMAARVGLGAFGVITKVTLQVEPAFRLHAVERPATWSETISSFDQWTTEHDHVEFFWFPHTGDCLTKLNDRTQSAPEPVGKFRAWWEDEFLSNKVYGAVNRLGRTAPGYVPTLNKLAGKLLSERTYIDDSYKVFTSQRDVRFAEMEYNLPRAALLPALAEVRELLDNGPWRISFPLEVRSLPADDAWLSPATERDSGYIACHAFQRTDRDWFRNVEAIMKSHGGRPHWGKLNTRTAADLAPAYPNWQRVQQIRDEVDPTRTFANDYTRRVLGT